MDPCWYVTASWCIHDERWIAALHAQGFDPRIISLERDGMTVEQAREQLRKKAHDGDLSPVLAGPLTSVTEQLVGIPQRLVGLSWGFDLLEPTAAPANLDQLDHLIVDSPASAAIARAVGLPSERISQIYWGIDLDVFTPDGPCADLTVVGVPQGAPTVLSLRAHEDLYRVGDLIEAWPAVRQQHEDAHLLIGNTGSLTNDLMARVHELEISDNVHFVGRISEHQLPELLRVVTLYVSTSPMDGTSVTLLQAMACGCPILVTDAPGNRHWIQRNSGGYLFSPRSIDELGQVIDEALVETRSQHQRDMIEVSLRAVRSRADWRHNQQLLRTALAPDIA